MVEAAKDAVKSFISSMRDLYTEKLEAAEHWARARDLLEVLVLNEEFQKMTDAWPTGDGKQYVIYEDPDYGFVIDGLVRGSYHAAPAHDHAHTWTA